MKNKLFTITLLIACFAADTYAFVSPDCKAKDGWSFLQTNKEVKSSLISDLIKDNITLGQPFSFNLAICPTNKNKPDRITANATMPAHKHGMNYKPTVSFDEQNQTYKVEDFLFHMPGLWEVSVSTYVGDVATHYTKDITVN